MSFSDSTSAEGPAMAVRFRVERLVRATWHVVTEEIRVHHPHRPIARSSKLGSAPRIHNLDAPGSPPIHYRVPGYGLARAIEAAAPLQVGRSPHPRPGPLRQREQAG